MKLSLFLVVSFSIFIVVGFFITDKEGMEYWGVTAILTCLGLRWIYQFTFGKKMYAPTVGTALLVGEHSVSRFVLFMLGLALYLTGVFL